MPRTLAIVAVLVAVICAATVLPAAADVKLCGIFTDNMVLQRDMAVPIWGTAEPGEAVTVTIGDQTRTATADEAGKWRATFDALAIDGPFSVTVTGNNEITLSNCVLGDVWVCSGQSNMGMVVRSCINADDEIAAADFPLIRLFNYGRKPSPEPLDDLTGAWVECSPETVGGFSAAAYFFGRDVHQQTGVPIGLINTSWGGTPAEAWTSDPVLKSYPEFQPIFDSWARVIEAYPEALRKYNEETLPAWQKQVEEAKAAGETPPRQPRAPNGPDAPTRPSNLFNGMINPIVGLAIKGATWYQGEANAGRAYQYRTLLPAMIGDWRDRWGQGDLPFIIVQLANFMKMQEGPEASTWAELREAQVYTAQTVPDTGLACIIDIGMADNIHPINKQDVGKRLALWALAHVYGQDVVDSGPTCRSMDVEGSTVRISFDNLGGGLCTRATENAPDPATLVGFTIAGEDQQFVMAEATIDGDTVVVSSPDVAEPVAVRYGWANNPVCNLYNEADLPAVPFRTDDWPGITWPKEQ